LGKSKICEKNCSIKIVEIFLMSLLKEKQFKNFGLKRKTGTRIKKAAMIF
jgi:hypothetical protein